MDHIFRRMRGAKSPGQGLLEFALALPIFLLLVMGIIEFGRLLAVASSVYTAAREGARYGSASGTEGTAGNVPYYFDCTGIRAAAERVGFIADIQDSNITIGYDKETTDTVALGTDQCADPGLHPDPMTYDYRIVVNVTTNFHFLFLGLPEFPISSQSARTILTQVDLDSTQGPTFTPRPTHSPTPAPSITPTPTLRHPDTKTPRPTSTVPPTVTGTPPTRTPTGTPTGTFVPTLTFTPTETQIPACTFLGYENLTISEDQFTASIVNYSNGMNQATGTSFPVPIRAVITGITISWSPKDPDCGCANPSLQRVQLGDQTIYYEIPGWDLGNSPATFDNLSVILPPFNGLYSNLNSKQLELTYSGGLGAVSVDIMFDMGCHLSFSKVLP